MKDRSIVSGSKQIPPWNIMMSGIPPSKPQPLRYLALVGFLHLWLKHCTAYNWSDSKLLRWFLSYVREHLTSNTFCINSLYTK